MKKLTLLVVSLIFCQFLLAQKNVIKLAPFGIAYGKYNLQYERMVTEHSSASISCSYIHPAMPDLGFIDDIMDNLGIETSLGGFASELDYRLYSPKKTGMRGFYVAPYLRYTTLGAKIGLDDPIYELAAGLKKIETGFKGNRSGLGVKLGAQWVLFNCVTIDWNFFGLGADYYLLKTFSEGTVVKNGTSYSTQETEKKGFFLPAWNTDFSIGYTF